MKKVKVLKIKEAVEKSNKGEKTTVGLSEMAVISNESGTVHLFIENDACHFFADGPETVKIGVAKVEPGVLQLMPDSFVYPTADHIVQNIESYEVELPEWISYFNIKSRIKSNCQELADSLRSLGIDAKEYLGELKK